MAYFLGVSSQIDILLLAQIVPTILQAMIGGGAGEILVIKRNKVISNEGFFEAVYITICLGIIILLGILYLISLGWFIPFFNLNPETTSLFKTMSIIFIVNMIPGTFTSILRPHLYSKGLYGFFTYSSVISQIIGVGFIFATIKSLGIFSFAYGLLLTSFINAFWFSLKSEIPFQEIFYINGWKMEFNNLKIMLNRVFSLSLQTLFNQLGTFWERSLSVKYLSGGYLSSLNYAKTLSELPNVVLLSSVLTTSYMEQVKRHKKDNNSFSEYTVKTLKILLNVGFILQLLMLFFAPVLIIVIFRRGKFDNNAVQSTLIIFNILTVSFLPRMLLNFFSRTMYIVGEYKKLFWAVVFKFIIQLLIMVSFITLFYQAIPVAILAGNIFIAILLFYYVGNKTQLPSIGFFIGRLIFISGISLLLLFIHTYTLPLYINKSTFQIILIFTPFMILSFIIFYFFLRKRGLLPDIITRYNLGRYTKNRFNK
ncbi:MAG: hypothetical protein A2041_09595 [Bacteroidetes bacterium GWA2_31_9b]|nr:MAG: hypothetical protein A2041_09595 [Bacteroidetes bacterium GWA2_31_9b]